jgi:hypothetical protein
MNKLDLEKLSVAEISKKESEETNAGSPLSWLIGYIVGTIDNLNDSYNDAIPDGWIGPRR